MFRDWVHVENATQIQTCVSALADSIAADISLRNASAEAHNNSARSLESFSALSALFEPLRLTQSD